MKKSSIWLFLVLTSAVALTIESRKIIIGNVHEGIESAPDLEYCKDRNWLKFKDHCYSFEGKSQHRLSYYDADDFCRSQGANLVSIHSEEENTFIFNAVNDRYGGRRWIGLNEFVGAGQHRWSDETAVNFTKFYAKKQYVKEKCYILFSKGAWRPEHCELRYYPICKRSDSDETSPTNLPPRTTFTPPGNCPEDWLQYEKNCYKFFGAKVEERKQFKDAKLACMALGEDHDLVSIHNLGEQAFLTQSLAEFGTSAWIGFSQIESDEIGHILVFGWTDNSRVDFTYWAPGNPQRGTWKNCAHLSFEGVGKGEWLADYCSIDKRGYICQRPPVAGLREKERISSNCDDKSVEYQGSCYRYFSSPKHWSEAEMSCQSFGAHLVSLSNSFEQAFLLNFISDKSKPVWTGLRTVERTNIFRWPDSQPLYYANWKVNESFGDFQTTPACVSMIPDKSLEWNVTSCALEYPYVCEVTKETPPSVSDDIIGQCPSEELSWIDIGDNYCYHLGQDKNDVLTWGTTSRYCISKGMEMITLNNDHQVNSLMPYVWKQPYCYWLALIKSFDRGSFIWMDGSSLNYTNWKGDKPTSWTSSADCVAFSTRDSKWVPVPCNDWNGNICRVKKTLKSDTVSHNVQGDVHEKSDNSFSSSFAQSLLQTGDQKEILDMAKNSVFFSAIVAPKSIQAEVKTDSKTDLIEKPAHSAAVQANTLQSDGKAETGIAPVVVTIIVCFGLSVIFIAIIFFIIRHQETNSKRKAQLPVQHVDKVDSLETEASPVRY